MYCFLVCAGLREGSPTRLLEKSARVTREIMPSAGAEAENVVRRIPEIRGGWFYMVPGVDSAPGLIREFVSDRLAVIFFGDLYESGLGNPAGRVAGAWESGGAEAVRLLDGSFSAVVVDRKKREVTVLSDLIGRRSLRYRVDGDGVFISTHDVPLVATGRCPTEFDLESACSIVSFEWSLEGRGLLKNVKVCHPGGYLVWRDGSLKRECEPLVKPDCRLEEGDRAAILGQVDRMIEKMRSVTRVFCEGSSTARIGLTAGADSRAILGVLLSVIDRSVLRAFTTGEPGSLDATVARRLAFKYGVMHETKIPAAPTPDDFLEHSRLLAFFMNGEADSAFALSPLPTVKAGAPPVFSGLGSGIFRKAYYTFREKDSIRRLGPVYTAGLLERRFINLSNLPWASNDSPDMLRKRLLKIVRGYYDFFPHGADVLDLFHLYERLGGWGSFHQRAWWRHHFRMPFATPSVIRLAFALPPPIENDLILHKRIVRRFLPEVYCWPINNETFLPLISYSWLLYSGDILCREISYQWRKRCVKRKRKKARSVDEVRVDLFVNPLGPLIRDILLTKGSFGIRMFGRKGLENLIAEYMAGRRKTKRVLGYLLTMENWRRLIERTAALSKPG